MDNMFEIVSEVLKKDERLVSDNKLLKNKIMELILKHDGKLLELLMNHDRIKKHFFTEVNGTLIFDKDKFIKFVNNKQFLPDSYTTFKNKIGLTSDGEYLDKKKEVVLAWPYKDCVLEGDQADPDEDRNEIFWNEILAPDEIDRLLDPKVLTDFKRIDEEGEHKNPDLKSSDNLIIRGNNLLVLQTIKNRFRRQVKSIYLDFPYNTGNDEFNYNDNFNHSTWLTFVKNRLETAKDFLREDGVIFVHTDRNEHAYLKVLMDEVFGRENFIETITVVNNPRGRDYGGIANMHEFILVYSLTNDYKLYRIEDKKKSFPYEDEIGEFETRELRNRNTKFHKGNRPNLFYPFYVNSDETDKNGFYEISLEKKEGWDKTLPMKSQGVQTVWRWSKEKVRENMENVCAKKRRDGSYMILEKYRDKTRMVRSVWSDKKVNSERGTLHLKDMFGKKVFDHPKPEETIKRIVEISTKENDLVLDFTLGSGTTAAVAHKMNRQYIGIEQMNYITDVTVERIKKVIHGEGGGISEEVDWHGGGSFVYCELMKWNQRYIDKIKEADTKSELLEIWKEMKEEAFLSYKLDPGKFDENVNEFKELSLRDQKRFLMKCLDKNHLYINLSEIDDEEYEISGEDKKMNKQFYRGF